MTLPRRGQWQKDDKIDRKWSKVEIQYFTNRFETKYVENLYNERCRESSQLVESESEAIVANSLIGKRNRSASLAQDYK